MNISTIVKDNLEQISDLLGNSKDLIVEAHGLDGAAGIVYLSSLTDHQDIQANLLQPLMPL